VKFESPLEVTGGPVYIGGNAEGLDVELRIVELEGMFEVELVRDIAEGVLTAGIDVLIVELIMVLTDKVEASVLLTYRFNLPPFPQYSSVFPPQSIVQSESGATVAAGLMALPHQHSRPYSAPKYLYAAHCAAQISIVSRSMPYSCVKARPVAGSA
jgi:hypothetical protein